MILSCCRSIKQLSSIASLQTVYKFSSSPNLEQAQKKLVEMVD